MIICFLYWYSEGDTKRFLKIDKRRNFMLENVRLLVQHVALFAVLNFSVFRKSERFSGKKIIVPASEKLFKES